MDLKPNIIRDKPSRIKVVSLTSKRGDAAVCEADPSGL
jgi:hypothetical protein